MPYLTNLAAAAKRTGHPVIEVPGWETRGHGAQPFVRGIVAHHTAGRDDMHVVRDGRPGLDGPLSQIWLKHDGSIWVVAAGLCWHNAPSTSANHTNSNSIGIEAENDGRAPWPAVQLDSYRRLCAELCREYGLPASAVKAHREVQPGKPDPHSINMTTFRADVARLIAGEDDDVTAKDLWQHELPVPFGSKENPSWQAGNVLVNIATWTREIEAKIDAQHATIKTLATALAQRDEAVDVDVLVGKIRAEIERVTVRLDIPAA